MPAKIISAMLIIIGFIHLLPVMGVISSARLATLYDIDVTGRDLEILLRHRAVLFGILGSYFCYAAFKPASQPTALVFSGISIVSFLLLTATVGDFNAAIKRVVVADLIALACWVVAVVLYVRSA